MAITARVVREKFATQVKPEILSAVRKIAEDEGRQLQTLIDEALADLVVKHQRPKARQHVTAAYKASVEEFGEVYKKLAK